MSFSHGKVVSDNPKAAGLVAQMKPIDVFALSLTSDSVRDQWSSSLSVWARYDEVKNLSETLDKATKAGASWMLISRMVVSQQWCSSRDRWNSCVYQIIYSLNDGLHSCCLRAMWVQNTKSLQRITMDNTWWPRMFLKIEHKALRDLP